MSTTPYTAEDALPIDVQSIIDYEEGSLSIEGTLHLFASLIRRGHLPHLQGHYGRAAADLTGQGLISAEGRITDYGYEVIDIVTNTEPF